MIFSSTIPVFGVGQLVTDVDPILRRLEKHQNLKDKILDGGSPFDFSSGVHGAHIVLSSVSSRIPN